MSCSSSVLLNAIDDFDQVHGRPLILLKIFTSLSYICREQPDNRAFELGKIIDNTHQCLHCS